MSVPHAGNVLVDFLCLNCHKPFEIAAYDLAICPRCGAWRSDRADPQRNLIPVGYFLATRSEKIELGFCYVHEALVPKAGGCSKCKAENRPQPFRRGRFRPPLKPFIHEAPKIPAVV